MTIYRSGILRRDERNWVGLAQWSRDDGETVRGIGHIEVSWRARFGFGGKLSTVGEETIDLAVRVPFLAVYASFTAHRSDGTLVRLPAVRADGDCYVLDRKVWIRFDLGPRTTRGDGAYAHWLWNSGRLIDRALGRKVHSTLHLGAARGVMPDGTGCEIVWEAHEWKRQRWPRAERATWADIRFDSPVGSTFAVSGAVDSLEAVEAIAMAWKCAQR